MMGAGADKFSATGNLAALIALYIDGGSGNDTILGGNGEVAESGDTAGIDPFALAREGGRGRIDAAAQGNETLPYIMDLEPGTYATVGEPIAQQFTGIALPVKEKALQQAMLEAVDALIADGTYRTLLAKWKLTDNALEKATINAGQ
jgi:hypothetical protein